MNISLDLNYFINNIKNNKDKEFLKEYYEHFNKHIKILNDYIKIKQELKEIINKYDNKQYIIDDINNSIKIIENDGIVYKNIFKKELFELIKN